MAWNRLLNWGTPLIVIGALLVFGSAKLAAHAAEQKRESVGLLLKGVGTVLMVAGTLLILYTT